MGAVNLYDGLYDSLLDPFHAVQFLIQNPAGLHGINGFKIVILPLNVHHDGKGALGMAPLLRSHFMGAGHRQVPAGPNPYIVRQRPAGAVHEISKALNTGQLHVVPDFLLVLLCQFCLRRAACQQPFNHKLEKTVLRRQLGPSSKGHLPNLIDRVSVPAVLTGQSDTDMVFPQPAQQAGETGVNLQDIRSDSPVLLLELESGPLGLVGENAAGMVSPGPAAVIQNKHGLLRRSRRLIGAIYRVSALWLFFLFGCVAKIKYWHKNPP